MKAAFFGLATIGLIAATPAVAAPVVVFAQGNSTSGGVAVVTPFSVVSGRVYRVSQGVNDLWSSGPLPRYSDGNGIVPRTAVVGDDSDQAPGTQIGADFGLYTQGGLSARYGSLVNQLTGGNYQFIGANTTFTAAENGPLRLAYFDSNNGDNDGFITFDISAVPEPASWGLMILGFGAIGALTRRRRPSVRATFA